MIFKFEKKSYVETRNVRNGYGPVCVRTYKKKMCSCGSRKVDVSYTDTAFKKRDLYCQECGALI